MLNSDFWPSYWSCNCYLKWICFWNASIKISVYLGIWSGIRLTGNASSAGVNSAKASLKYWMNGKEMERDKPMYDTYMLLRFLRMHVRPAANSLHRAYSEEHDILSWVIYWWPSHDQNGIRLPTYSLSEMFGLLTQVLLRLLAGYCCAQVTHFTLSYSLYRILRNKTRNKTFNYTLYSTTTKI